MTAQLTCRRADIGDTATLAGLYEDVVDWMLDHGIDQWKSGAKDERHFERVIGSSTAEAWLAYDGSGVLGAYELWWSDEQAWGARPPVAGYVHRLMARPGAPAGTGRALLRDAERRIAAAGRELCRLDVMVTSPRLRTYYEEAGYAVVGELTDKLAADGTPYGVLLMERPLG
ncbi:MULTISPECIES: N-acetyltransferase [Streptomyces]|uniref:N-acetyltransferase n=1 Tax=Streptomyces venezuelae TaxID=54571 RepID=A0A5P2B8H2_STRVZ|nr:MULTISPECIES: N-acetyltransferase [Streptomyces]NEA01241.1 N-acetyltransferase [Streptomyces sp. SID10116]MYY84798.1 N-acetyltransferase [Streptomyces sp. SID335]MYZ16579.1 N-acetyltransferase [Streptomyces sp. SID337]NDZ91328.1 N-acetyltransferase [Streptomyces sp. SID10115]NEB45529.1 N-acetyltransferase [Streptomyces sp. SID339]